MSFNVKDEWDRYYESQKIEVQKYGNKYTFYLRDPEGFDLRLGDEAIAILFYLLKNEIEEDLRENLIINMQNFYLTCLENKNNLDPKIYENVKEMFLENFYTPELCNEKTKDLSLKVINYVANNYEDFTITDRYDNDVVIVREMEQQEVVDKLTPMFSNLMVCVKNEQELMFVDEIMTAYVTAVIKIKDINKEKDFKKEVMLIERNFHNVQYLKVDKIFDYFYKNENSPFNKLRDGDNVLSLNNLDSFCKICGNTIEINIKNIKTFFPRKEKDFIRLVETLITENATYFTDLLNIEKEDSRYVRNKLVYSVAKEDIGKLEIVKNNILDFFLEMFDAKNNKFHKKIVYSDVLKDQEKKEWENIAKNFISRIREQILLEQLSDANHSVRSKKKL